MAQPPRSVRCALSISYYTCILSNSQQTYNVLSFSRAWLILRSQLVVKITWSTINTKGGHTYTHTHTHTHPFNGSFSRTTRVMSQYQKGTRSSAIAEGPRDASCQLKSCQLPRNSAETTYTTSPDQIDGIKLRFSRRQCVIDNVHSTMTRSSRLPLSQVS